MSIADVAKRRGRRAGGAGSDAEKSDTDRRLAFLDHPLADYTLLLGATLALLALGLVMVFSASSVESFAEDGSIFSQFQKQALFATVGLPVMLWLSRRPLHFFVRIAPIAMITSLILLVVVLIPGIGINVNGQQNWIGMPGGFSLQPSEIAKLGLILWSARILSMRAGSLDNWREVTLPFLPMAGAVVVLVLLEGDVGTALVFMPIVAMLLFIVGLPVRFFLGIGALLLGLIAFMSVTEGYRMQRFATWLNPEADPDGAGWQIIHGRMALATGGWWGVGLGASREKWGALPEAHNDFIFAVIGEELGLVGTLLVLGLFLLIGLVAIRVARRTHSLFVRLATMGIVAWILTQATINIGAVIGIMPVTGVPLPFVSYGGSSLVLALSAVGVLLAFSRQEPAAAALIRSRAVATRRAGRAARRRAQAASAELVGPHNGSGR
ncbi:MAG: Peptidoglycan glycosyltransferase [Actinomycetota bacterium]|nr:Peptidoglycan glycosyltransferase [Actinomycetota bacterium]